MNALAEYNQVIKELNHNDPPFFASISLSTDHNGLDLATLESPSTVLHVKVCEDGWYVLNSSLIGPDRKFPLFETLARNLSPKFTQIWWNAVNSALSSDI